MAIPPCAARGSRASYRTTLLVVLLAGSAACEPDAARDTIEIASVRRVTVARLADDAPPPPADAFAGAPVVSLPDRWSLALRDAAHGAWYRATVVLDEAPRDTWAVYLPFVSMNAAVWVDGEPIGSGGRMAPTPAHDWHRPLLFPVPAGVLRAGANVVDVALAVQPTYAAGLGSFFVGPERALRPAYEWRFFWQVTAVQLTVLLTVYWGLAGLLLWWLHGEPRGLLASSAACFLWALAMLDLLVRDPPLPGALWQWLTLSALVGSIAAFAIGARRFLVLDDPRPARVLLGMWLVGAIAFALALADGAPALVELVVLGWGIAALVVALYLTRLFLLIRRRSEPVEGRAVRFLAPLAVVVLAFVLHDVLFVAGVALPPSLLLLPYAGAIIGLWGGVRVVERLSTALSESAALNRDLERRVDERGAEIARSYEQIRALERARLLQRERERLMRDVHDGIGSQLTSTLALVQSSRVTADEIADALRDALDDMRLLIAPLGPTADDLLTLLATWRARIERRLERRGLAFDWQVSDLPPLPWLGPREALNVLRIVQEAVANVVKHADATTIVVRTARQEGRGGEPGVLVEIGDDGRGRAHDGDADAARDGGAPRAASRGGARDAADGRPGFGLANMAARAAELGGTIEVARAEHGTRVSLWLPVARAPGVDDGPGAS